MKYCPYCGTKLNDEMTFCPGCGQRYVTAETIYEAKPNDNRPANTLGYATTAKAPQNRKQHFSKKWLIPVCVVLLLAVVGGVLFAPKIIHATQYNKAIFNLNNDDTLTAYKQLQALADIGYAKAQDELPPLKERLYNEMQRNYKDGYYERVIEIRDVISDYKNSEKYGILAMVRCRNDLLKYYNNYYSYDEIVPVLLNMKGFEDTLEVLVCNQDIATAYLKGTWKTKIGRNNFFTMDEDGNYNSNILKHNTGNTKKYWTIEDGKLFAYNSSNKGDAIIQYTFTPISEDMMQIFADRTQSIFILYKQ